MHSLFKGNLVHDVQKIHQKYGDIVRIAPNEISFAKGEAWRDIFAHRPGHLPFPKNPIWWSRPPGQVDSLVSVPDEENHARMRGLLNHGFTESALRAQEPLIQHYVDLLIERLHERATDPQTQGLGAVVDIVAWYNYTTFDIVGDLGFGEPFNCLRDSSYHPWVALIFTHFKATAFTAAVNFFPILEYILMKCLPKSVLKKQEDHFNLAAEKTQRRLNLETQRDDLMSHVIKHNDKGNMSVEEIKATFNLVIIAGSETTATVLSGVTNHLVQNPTVLQRLQSEVRKAFNTKEDITFSALRELSYLNAVLEEGLRMCPPVPASLSRVVPAGGDTVCGQFLPENVSSPFHTDPSNYSTLDLPTPLQTNVSVHQWTISNSPSNFHLPTSFAPSRWLPPPARPSEFDNDKRSSSQPFSVGPRSCIGKSLAYAEMRLILAKMVWTFDMEVPEKGKKVLDWAAQKTYVLVEKKPFEARLKSVRD